MDAGQALRGYNDFSAQHTWYDGARNVSKGFALEIPTGFGSQESGVRSAAVAGCSHVKAQDIGKESMWRRLIFTILIIL
jgi:hypothetical protein